MDTNPYIVGMVTATCHYCGEPIGADGALLIWDTATGHAECEETWRDLATGERGDKDP